MQIQNGIHYVISHHHLTKQQEWLWKTSSNIEPYECACQNGKSQDLDLYEIPHGYIVICGVNQCYPQNSSLFKQPLFTVTPT